MNETLEDLVCGVELLCLDAGNTVVFLDHARMAAICGAAGFATTARALELAEGRSKVAIEQGAAFEVEWSQARHRAARGWGSAVGTMLACAGLGPGRVPSVLEVLWREHAERNLWSLVPPRLVESLQAARACGVRVAIISNSEGMLERLLESLGVRSAIDLVVDSGIAGVEKPDPRIFKLALDHFSVSPGRALHLGDQYATDVLGARGAGMRVALIDPYGHLTGRHLEVPRVTGVPEVAFALGSIGRAPAVRSLKRPGRAAVDRVALAAPGAAPLDEESNMAVDKKLIAVLPGDGIGPEVIAQATRVLEFYRDERGLPLELWPLDLGADRYLRDRTTYPKEVHARIAAEASAVLVGALGDPRVPGLEHARDILFGLRFGLDLYANVRPVRALSDRLVPLKGRTAKDVNLVVFRENTEGIYVGMGGQFKRGTRDEVAINEDLNTRKGVERLVRAGFEYARARGKKRVHMADKSNAMKHAHELWYRVFFEVAKEYPEIAASHVYVDAMCLYLVQDPSQFEVVVTCNLFGDIVTDLGAALQGGLGMAASANVHPRVAGCCDSAAHAERRVGMFEPVHGSAPPLAGKDLANPLASVLTVGMMLSHLGWPDEEARLERIVSRAVAEGKCTRDVGGELGTRAVGDWVLGELAHAF